MDSTPFLDPVTHAQFMAAAAGNDTETLQRYLKQGGDVDLVNAAGESALLVATRAGHKDFLVDLLLDASPRFESRWAGSAQEAASLAGRPDLAARIYEAMLERMRPVPPDALLQAVRVNDMPVVRRCLAQEGDDPDSFDGQLGPALVTACDLGRYGIAALLLSAGADPFFHQPGGLTPLAEAAAGGDTRFVDLLLAHAGADVPRLVNPSGSAAPLDEAVLYHRAEMARRLLEAGAKTCVSERLIAFSALRHDDNCTDVEAAHATLNLVLDATSADELAESIRVRNATVLHLAAETGASWSIGMLVERGFAVDAGRYHDAGTPFLAAAATGNIGCLRELAAHGSDITRRTTDGKSALTLAIEGDDEELNALLENVVACLLELGCDPEIPDDDGLSPRMRAVQHPELIRMMDARAARKAILSTVGRASPAPPSAPT